MNEYKKEFQQVPVFHYNGMCSLLPLVFICFSFIWDSFSFLSNPFSTRSYSIQPAHFKSSYKTLYARNVHKKIDSAASFSWILMKVALSPLMDSFPLLLDLQASMS